MKSFLLQNHICCFFGYAFSAVVCCCAVAAAALVQAFGPVLTGQIVRALGPDLTGGRQHWGQQSRQHCVQQ
jgi:hypothetical protein